MVMTSCKFLRGSNEQDHVEKVEESNETVKNINCLPEEMLLEIFGYLSHNELGRNSRVCKWWYEITRRPKLWKKVNVDLLMCAGSQTEIVVNFCEILPTCLTELKLSFRNCYWKEHLKFEDLCPTLARKCPSLKILFLHRTKTSVNPQSVIDLCRHFLNNLEVLSFDMCEFTDDSARGEYTDHSKIKVLDLCSSKIIRSSGKGEIYFETEAVFPLFEDDALFLDNLEVLSLQSRFVICSRSFQTLHNRAFKLTHLYLCRTNLGDRDFNFPHSAFPQLKTICLIKCFTLTAEGVVSLVRTCQSLQNVYVHKRVALAYAQHPFVLTNRCKLQIVKEPLFCGHHVNL